MTSDKTPNPSLPPEISAYLKGAATKAHLQFDFLIGDWDVVANRYAADGSVDVTYQAIWSAQYINDKRMIIDDSKALAPTGEPVSSFVTLRTYSEARGRWEITGLQALQPALTAEWFGEFIEGEMFLHAAITTPDGSSVQSTIRFFDISQRKFLWENKMSFDGGKSRIEIASLMAIRP